MGTLFFVAIISFISGFAAFTMSSSAIRQLKIRSAIKSNKRLLKNMQDKNTDGKFHTYNDLFQYSLLNLRGKLKNLPQKELQNMVDKEIKRLSQSLVKRSFTSMAIFLKSGASLAMVFLCLISALLFIDEYQVIQEADAAQEKAGESKKTAESSKVNDTKTADGEQEAKDKQAKREMEKQAAKEKKEKEEAAAIQEKNEKDKAIYENGLDLSDKGQLEEAIKELEKIDEKSIYYEKSSESIEVIKNNLYWSNVLYPTYTEITKSPQYFTGKTVGFSGVINDIIEADGKTLIIIGTEYLGGLYDEHISDILVLYPETTNYMEGDIINISGSMKGNFIMTEQDNLVGSYFNTPVSFSTSAFTDQNQMPVIVGDYLY